MLFCAASGFGQGVPVRLSFKFILNAQGNRPATGNLNTDAEVNDQVARGNQIFSQWISELRFEGLEIVDVAGVSQWYLAAATPAVRDGVRAAAQANPTAYHWRTDAINLYITAANDSAISDFPPSNNIVLLCQGSSLTTVAHEMGHILSLWHTHQPTGDYCSDTLADDQTWNRDDIALNAYGQFYTNLTSAQQYQVDMVWGNLMSYHNPDFRWMLSPCQMDRQSTQGYKDRNWLLSKVPVYVDGRYGGTHSGSFTQPYQTIQHAINAGGLNDTVLVLETGTHAKPAGDLTPRVDMITRKGTSTVQDAPPQFSLPYTLEDSANVAVRQAIVRAQKADREKDLAGVITNLLEAEKQAAGREKSSIQLELAQRFRDSQRYEEAAAWFKKTAEGADQPALQKHALGNSEAMTKKAEQHRQEAQPEEKKDKPK